MGYQDFTIKLEVKEIEILKLEKKYFDLIKEVLDGETFIQDLILIEKEISENYQIYEKEWNLKNKFKLAAERLVRHYMYSVFHNEINGIYPSPISSDFAIMTGDCALNIDVKTIDIQGNAGDIVNTALEANQNSFDNRNFPYIDYRSSLPKFDHYKSKPVLTYIVKMIYSDDNFTFRLSRDKHPTLILVCIPNGHLSRLFDYNVIANFKTYNYYNKKDGKQFEAIEIPEDFDKDDEGMVYSFAENNSNEKRNLVFDYKASREYKGKIVYNDSFNKCLWWSSSKNNKTYLMPLKNGSSVRYNNKYLEKRYDEQKMYWSGIFKKTVKSTLIP